LIIQTREALRPTRSAVNVVIIARTAKTLELAIAWTLFARAGEVLE
jgi:hypothetical protein